MKSISSWVPAEIAERLARGAVRMEPDEDEAYDRARQREIDIEAEIVKRSIKLDRQRMAHDVLAVISTAAAGKTVANMVDDIIKICGKEAE